MAEAPATAIRLFFQGKGSFALSRFRFARRNEANKLVSAISAAFLPSPSTGLHQLGQLLATENHSKQVTSRA